LIHSWLISVVLTLFHLHILKITKLEVTSHLYFSTKAAIKLSQGRDSACWLQKIFHEIALLQGMPSHNHCHNKEDQRSSVTVLQL
jgi:hypothetical protein